MVASTIVRPGHWAKGNNCIAVTSLCWNMVGIALPNLTFIHKIVGRHYDVAAFVFQESFTFFDNDTQCVACNLAGYMAYICQRNELHPARGVPFILLSYCYRRICFLSGPIVGVLLCLCTFLIFKQRCVALSIYALTTC